MAHPPMTPHNTLIRNLPLTPHHPHPLRVPKSTESPRLCASLSPLSLSLLSSKTSSSKNEGQRSTDADNDPIINGDQEGRLVVVIILESQSLSRQKWLQVLGFGGDSSPRVLVHVHRLRHPQMVRRQLVPPLRRPRHPDLRRSRHTGGGGEREGGEAHVGFVHADHQHQNESIAAVLAGGFRGGVRALDQRCCRRSRRRRFGDCQDVHPLHRS